MGCQLDNEAWWRRVARKAVGQGERPSVMCVFCAKDFCGLQVASVVCCCCRYPYCHVCQNSANIFAVDVVEENKSSQNRKKNHENRKTKSTKMKTYERIALAALSGSWRQRVPSTSLLHSRGDVVSLPEPEQSPVQVSCVATVQNCVSAYWKLVKMRMKNCYSCLSQTARASFRIICFACIGWYYLAGTYVRLGTLLYSFHSLAGGVGAFRVINSTLRLLR